MKLNVIAVAYHRAIPLRILIDSFLLQTDNRWQLQIVHDGIAPQDVVDVMGLYDDLRLEFIQTEIRRDNYGHPNRRIHLEKLGSCKDFVLLTNDDNYYVPVFVEKMLKEAEADLNMGFVMCNTVHSHYDYNLHKSFPKHGDIDMGAFIVRLDVARAVGFNHIDRGADGRYAEECADYCRLNNIKIIHINKPLFIHN